MFGMFSGFIVILLPAIFLMAVGAADAMRIMNKEHKKPARARRRA